MYSNHAGILKGKDTFCRAQTGFCNYKVLQIF